MIALTVVTLRLSGVRRKAVTTIMVTCTGPTADLLLTKVSMMTEVQTAEALWHGLAFSRFLEVNPEVEDTNKVAKKRFG